jgi:hypothetical protein
LAREQSEQLARSKGKSVVVSGLLLQLSSQGGASRRGDLRDCFTRLRRIRNDKKAIEKETNHADSESFFRLSKRPATGGKISQPIHNF